MPHIHNTSYNFMWRNLVQTSSDIYSEVLGSIISRAWANITETVHGFIL
jgi:hypothetical protein